jgi:uncharacterized membrane protein YqjE
MAAEEPAQSSAQSEGLLQSLRTLLATLIALARTRLELLSTELEDEKLRILQLLVWACAAAFFVALGVVMLTVFVLIVFWDVNRVLTAFALAAGYLALGVAFGIRVRNLAREKSRLFAASLAELAKDRERLTSR